MVPYKNLSGNSDVVAYELGEGYIWVQFISGPEAYLYTNASVGKINIKRLQTCAKEGKGLCTYIDRYCHSLYERKEIRE